MAPNSSKLRQFTFLELPAEIRNQIYAYIVIASAGSMICPVNPLRRATHIDYHLPKLGTIIFLLNKQILQEAQTLLFAQNCINLCNVSQRTFSRCRHILSNAKHFKCDFFNEARITGDGSILAFLTAHRKLETLELKLSFTETDFVIKEGVRVFQEDGVTGNFVGRLALVKVRESICVEWGWENVQFVEDWIRDVANGLEGRMRNEMLVGRGGE
ncbi:hypothetical protein EJ08DRAFT_738779 [Tothia fuscella]|uniref:Uncharacterized protein n=1 Tax=Tothia fuscella TaxID=1048955 RepID=A0A9P4TTI6_9PEZI|nr:hypothetical protein EJ08DRAFT_738779 [Tothia fuscella]